MWTRAMKCLRVKTHVEHSELGCVYLLPGSWLSLASFSWTPPASQAPFPLTAGHLLPCVVGDVETGFGCLMTDWSQCLLCRITVGSRQFRKSKGTANQRDFSISQAGVRWGSAGQAGPFTDHIPPGEVSQLITSLFSQ